MFWLSIVGFLPRSPFGDKPELKEKDIFGGKVSYLRAQAVQGEVRSDVKLLIGQYDDANNYIRDLPSTKVVEQGRRFSVGFVSA